MMHHFERCAAALEASRRLGRKNEALRAICQSFKLLHDLEKTLKIVAVSSEEFRLQLETVHRLASIEVIDFCDVYAVAAQAMYKYLNGNS